MRSSFSRGIHSTVLTISRESATRRTPTSVRTRVKLYPCVIILLSTQQSESNTFKECTVIVILYLFQIFSKNNLKDLNSYLCWNSWRIQWVHVTFCWKHFLISDWTTFRCWHQKISIKHFHNSHKFIIIWLKDNLRCHRIPNDLFREQHRVYCFNLDISN